ncbi:MAG: hypothetical protein GWN93_27050 [Deltaproteobacteria bacterium]|nr:hypothetical protein [Deltaproteobacteria bacterium]
MSSWALDENQDLKVTNNSLTLTEGQEAIRQHMTNRFQTFLGEWFLDTSVGVPYFQQILIKNPAAAVVQDILKATILQTPGVISILNFDADYDVAAREFSLEFTADTINGPIDFSQIVEV